MERFFIPIGIWPGQFDPSGHINVSQFSAESKCRECSKVFTKKRNWHIYCRRCFRSFVKESIERVPDNDLVCGCKKAIILACSRCILSATDCTHCLWKKNLRGKNYASDLTLHFCFDCI